MNRYLMTLLVMWLLASPSYCQQVLQGQVWLRGKVLDKATRKPLPFASIARDERYRIASGEDGAFALPMAPSSILTVTFVGYRSAKISLPNGFAGTEYTTEVLLEQDVILLPGVRVGNLPEEQFKDQFMGLKVETEDEKNARSNLARVWAQANLGVTAPMDNFANYRYWVNGPQGVSIITLGGGQGKGLIPALKRATQNPSRFSGPQRGAMPGASPISYQYHFAKPVLPTWTYRPIRPDTTPPAGASCLDSLQLK
ncbi:MAG: hypothetical protein V4714_23080 [Bacteroidota bacterium]